ncbi:uncharacterized protein LOC100901161 [Galendromus occidentalis]|uniref:Uncharacterized protein LOC100901161 n=1 Tax=Galendromus occidentalis TaxID=34638 RepID=A0AAJ6QSG2_9ACAR|nr:uncharacterized protein LOC100901161 [Galendromus occidentalis]
MALRLFENYPEELRLLFLPVQSDDMEFRNRHKNFHENIRNFNSALAPASVGARLAPPGGQGPFCYKIHDQIYHRIGALHPEPDNARRYGQVYILDTEQATDLRLQQNSQCDSNTMRTLSSLLMAVNPCARALKMMSEIEAAENQLALREQRPHPKLTMRFEKATSRGLESRPYDLPTANEVAVVYVTEHDDVLSQRSLAVHQRSGTLTHISILDERCDTLAYPLFFPTGQSAWHPNSMNSEHKKTTQKDFYSCLLSVRNDEFNPLLHGRKLLQRFVVDAYVKIEQNRLNYHRTHQRELRLDTYSGLSDHFHDDVPGPPGRRIVLPTSFIGSPRNMQQSYQDAMAIVAKHGKPDIFMTTTCNPNWAEIKENLYSGQSACDRPDLVSRVFQLKLAELYKDLFKEHIFGRVVAFASVIEFQKRGLPHCHMLLILASEFKPRTAGEVDTFCCAEVPDPQSEAPLHQAVKSFMVHRRCGFGSQAPCMKDGKCTKKFPKSLRDTTCIAADRYPELRRLNRYTISLGEDRYGDESIVPYNPYLLLKYSAHNNEEICGWISAVKYLYKYVHKGPDRANSVISNDSDVDEIKTHLNARYVCAPEAMHRIFGYEQQRKSHAIHRLAVHLPDEQTVSFTAGHEREALRRARTTLTTLTAFFKQNADSEAMSSPTESTLDSRRLLHGDFPEHFVFDANLG